MDLIVMLLATPDIYPQLVLDEGLRYLGALAAHWRFLVPGWRPPED